jgi:hypothetical protein
MHETERMQNNNKKPVNLEDGKKKQLMMVIRLKVLIKSYYGALNGRRSWFFIHINIR